MKNFENALIFDADMAKKLEAYFLLDHCVCFVGVRRKADFLKSAKSILMHQIFDKK